MPVVISDEALEAAGLRPEEALVEFACRLYDAGKLSLWSAARLAGLSRAGFEQELLGRQIPIHRPTITDLQADLDALDRLER